MITPLSSNRRFIVRFVALLIVLTASSATATIKQSNFSTPVTTALLDGTAGWRGVNESSATGDCHLLVTLLRTKVLGYCTIEGGAPLTEIHLRVSGFDTPVFTTPVTGKGPFSFVVESASALLVRAFSSDGVTIQGHTVTGLEIEGKLRRPFDVTSFSVPLHSGQVVPPSDSKALAVCIVTILASPSFLGIDCSHNLVEPQTFELYLSLIHI